DIRGGCYRRPSNWSRGGDNGRSAEDCVARPGDEVLETVALGREADWVAGCGHNRVEEGHGLRRLDRRRIGYVQNVLIPHLQSRGEKVCRWIAKICIVHNWDDWARVLRAVNT